VVRSFESVLTSLKRRFDTDRITLFFTDTENFRKTVDPEYKGNRMKRKPVGYRRLIEWCFRHYDVVRLPQVEADDALGLYCHLDSSDFVLVSPDKDMKQIVCRHFNNEEEFDVTLEEADNFFFTQIITGDPVDGYKGVPGMGPVKAKKILDSTEDPWQAVVQAYEKAGLTLDDAIRNARLARILRPGEYDFDLHQPILWTPS
jgi:DNA polymerase-1